MRRVVFACALFALSVPAVTFAAGGADGDGTLVVRNGTGVMHIAAKGTIIGSCDKCTIWIDDPAEGDGSGPIVTGFEGKQDLTDTKSRWSGSDVRFRLIGGFSRTRVRGNGIDLYVVGRGSVTVRGFFNNVGTYAVDGGERRQLPFEPLTFQLGVKTD
ncbi:MAG: hypothetical protein M3321_03780 [Actinomycetota bacterium]|nr:hypothetical protein [Actinomycetota bacterium]